MAMAPLWPWGWWHHYPIRTHGVIAPGIQRGSAASSLHLVFVTFGNLQILGRFNSPTLSVKSVKLCSKLMNVQRSQVPTLLSHAIVILERLSVFSFLLLHERYRGKSCLRYLLFWGQGSLPRHISEARKHDKTISHLAQPSIWLRDPLRKYRTCLREGPNSSFPPDLDS